MSGEALTEVRQMLGVLRAGPAPASPHNDEPDGWALRDLEHLATAAGVQAVVSVAGDAACDWPSRQNGPRLTSPDGAESCERWLASRNRRSRMSSWWAPELYEAVLPDGADLAASRETPGLLRGFFRGSGGIEGHAEFAEVDLRARELTLAAVALATGVLATVIVMRNRERIKRWWAGQVWPAAQSVFDSVRRQHRAPAQPAAEEVAVVSGPAFEGFSSEIDGAFEGTTTRMSSAEALRHRLVILLAASIIADRMRTLANARIEGDLPVLAGAIKKLSTRSSVDAINRMLAAKSSLLDDEASAILMRVFGGGRVVDGQYVPLQVERVKEALRLPAHRAA